MTDSLATLGEMVRAYKTTVTRLIRRKDDALASLGVMNHAPTGFGWQRGYYEHVIRSQDELNTIRWYVLGNPARWDEDEDNPAFFNLKR